MNTPVPLCDPAFDGLDTPEPDSFAGELEQAFVHIGGIFVSAKPVVVSTILGSCVAVCVWDWKRGIGGLNHYLLAEPVCETMASPRTAAVAMRLLIAELIAAGADRRSLRARIVGGAGLMYGEPAGTATPGARNIAVARELLAAAGIPVVGEEVGGTRGRKLLFRTDDGSVEVRNL